MYTRPQTNMQLFNIVTIITISLLANAQCKKYEVVFDNEEIFTPCKKFPDKFITDHFDLSEFHFDNQEDNVVHAHGKVVLLKEYDKEKPINMVVDTFKKSRDEWVVTLYNMNRPDICLNVFDESQLWYQFIELLPEEDRVCPPPVGWSLSLDTNVSMILELSNTRADGDYKVEVKLGQDDEFMCFEILGSLYAV